MSFHGKQYKINLAFDHVLKFLDLISSDAPSDYLTGKTIQMFFGGQNIPKDQEFYQDFLKMLKKLVSAEPYSSGKGTASNANMVQSFSWSKDAGMIEAAFLETYHIDLMEEQGKLHWTKFKALFDGISDKTKLSQIIQIRQMTPNDVSKDMWPKIAEAQVAYSIDDPMKDVPKSKESANFNTLAMFNALLDKADGKGAD